MLSSTFTPRFYETDAFGHINNTVLNCWFETARAPIFDIFIDGSKVSDLRLILARTEVDFIAQVFYGHDVEVRSYIERIGNASFVVAHEAFQNDQLVATGRAVQVHFDHATNKSLPLTDALRMELKALQRPNADD
ncbi:MAG TPA: thioesterase family protein [Alcanivoracaceae bacterium]|nr:thioesterase family protein [Alcanivoracaceae bacterium]